MTKKEREQFDLEFKKDVAWSQHFYKTYCKLCYHMPSFSRACKTCINYKVKRDDK